MVKDESFFVVCGWMINRLGLKGVELELYAIIYGFSQTESQKFTGSLKYLQGFTGASRQTIISNLKSLVDKGLIEKEEKFVNGVKFNSYSALTPGLKTVPGGGTEIRPGGGTEIRPNNIDGDKINRDNIVRFKKPTAEEVRAYCEERHNGINPERFIDHYEANGWMIGRNKMKDWKAAVRTWERYEKKDEKPKEERLDDLDDIL